MAYSLKGIITKKKNDTANRINKKGKILSALFIIGFYALYCPTLSAAFDLFGFHLWGPKKPEEKEKTTSYKIDVFSTDTEKNLLKTSSLTTKNTVDGIEIVKESSELFINSDTEGASSVRLLTKARDDYKKILHAFYAEGCYSATISIRINGVEAASMAPETILPKKSYITIMVNP